MTSPLQGNLPLYFDPRFAYQTGFTPTSYGTAFPGWGEGFTPVPKKQGGFLSRFFSTILPIGGAIGAIGLLVHRHRQQQAGNTPEQPTIPANGTQPARVLNGAVVNMTGYHKLTDNPTLESLQRANSVTIQYAGNRLPTLSQDNNQSRFQAGLQDLVQTAKEDFDHFDLNHDGGITQEELVVSIQVQALKLLRAQGKNPFGDAKLLKETLDQAKNEALLTFQTEDFRTNQKGQTDGKITLDEHAAIFLAQDGGATANWATFQPDGAITQSELSAFRQKQLSRNGLADLHQTLNIFHAAYHLAERTGEGH